MLLLLAASVVCAGVLLACCRISGRCSREEEREWPK